MLNQLRKAGATSVVLCVGIKKQLLPLSGTAKTEFCRVKLMEGVDWKCTGFRFAFASGAGQDNQFAVLSG